MKKVITLKSDLNYSELYTVLKDYYLKVVLLKKLSSRYTFLVEV